MQTWIAEQVPLQITECPIESAFLEKAPNLGTLHALSRRMSILNQHPVKFRDKTFHSPEFIHVNRAAQACNYKSNMN